MRDRRLPRGGWGRTRRYGGASTGLKPAHPVSVTATPASSKVLRQRMENNDRVKEGMETGDKPTDLCGWLAQARL